MDKPKVVVAEVIAPAGIEALERTCSVDDASGVSRSDLLERLQGAQGLVVRSATMVDAELLAAAPGLKVVGRAGVGVDNIDLKAATEAGVLVVNAPTANTISA
ncbi:MAG: phosphoglycerate dehydrogenase, partial [Acidimicrobiia bacterium]|nr:phosphoglycerate dehydrogenase [Acidimicrobiia bacterium]